MFQDVISNKRNPEESEKLKRIRKKQGLTQKETASILGISQSRYSNYENGYATIPNNILNHFCKVFTIERDEYFPERKSNCKSNNECVEYLILNEDFKELRSEICSIKSKRKRRDFAMEFMNLTKKMIEEIKEYENGKS